MIHSEYRVRKRSAAFGMILALLLLLAGCATVPPVPMDGSYVEATDAPDVGAPVEGLADDPQEPATEGAGQEGAAQTQVPGAQATATLAPIVTGDAPGQVEIYYSGAPSMMGFADSYAGTIYEDAMEALAACVSLTFPSAQASYYRYHQDIPKADMRHSKELILAQIGHPSFYRDFAMTKQPERIKYPEEAARAVNEKMNEPIASFYEAANLPDPWAKSNSTGLAMALGVSDPAALRIFVTDLHELRADDGALISALNQSALASGHAIGLVAMNSEFSGYIPDVGANSTSYVWGAVPNGSLETLLDFGEYKLGVSVDPQTRAMAQRPFYILCIGDQAAVGAYVQTLTDRLGREFQNNRTFELQMALFGSSYVSPGYGLAGNAQYISGQGVTAIADATAPAGVGRVELKASQQTRYLEWDLTYKVHPSDPRGAGITAGDFQFTASAVGDGGSTALPDLTWSVLSATREVVTLRLRLEFPAGVIKQGSYSLEIAGSLAAPQSLPGSDWVGDFGWDADGSELLAMEQNLAEFDGSRTLFLSRLMDALGMANLNRLGGASLGKLVLQLTVYA